MRRDKHSRFPVPLIIPVQHRLKLDLLRSSSSCHRNRPGAASPAGSLWCRQLSLLYVALNHSSVSGVVLVSSLPPTISVIALFLCSDETSWPKATWRQKGLLYVSQPITEGSQGWYSTLEHGGRDGSRGHGGMLLTGLFSVTCSVLLLIRPRTTCPGVEPPTVNWTLLHQSLIKKIHYRQSDGDNFSSEMTLDYINSSEKSTRTISFLFSSHSVPKDCWWHWHTAPHSPSPCRSCIWGKELQGCSGQCC